jgi:CTP synthase
MRLGGHDIQILRGTKAFEIYSSEKIRERHRHRYEVNPNYLETLEEAGLIFSGKSMDGRRMEILEIKDRPFLATQFHPEFKSRPGKPAPVFKWFISEALKRSGQF